MSREFPGEVPRLRAGAAAGATGEAAALAERAAAIIRAVEPPAPLGPRAQARVLAGLGPRSASSLRRRRLLVPALTLFGIVGTGLGAAAALRWIRSAATPASTGADRQTAASPGRLPPQVDPAPAAPAPAAAVVEAPLLDPAGKPVFERARRAIDASQPRQAANQLEIPSDFARGRAGHLRSWRVKVCVSPTGQVSSASALDQVPPALDRQISRAIESWKYFPATSDGRPIHSCMVYRLTVEPARARLKAKAEP